MLERFDHGEVLELRLARPPANALSPELFDVLADALYAAPESGARALVLSGRPGMFSAGLDVPVFLGLDRAGVRAAWGAFFNLMGALASSAIPVAAAIGGHAPGGGCVLALFCDRRVMAAGAFKIGLNEVRVGLRMPRPIHAAAVHVVGTRRAEELCTSGALYTAAEALAFGLVDEVVPPDQVNERALAWAREMAALPPVALRKTRLIARERLRAPLDRVDEDALELFMDDWFSAETQEALGALAARLRR